MSTVPLTALLSWAWVAQVMEIDNAVEAAGAERVGRLFKISLPMWANALRLIEAEGISLGELRRRAGAACNVGGLERWGWISVGEAGGARPGFGSARGLRVDTVLSPTRAGRYARRLFPEMVAVVEQRWRDRFGSDAVEALRGQLVGGVRPLLPWSPPEVHSSDGFVTHVTGGERAPKDAPLVALLGQCLTERTVEAERRAMVSLPLAANLLRVLGDGPVAVRALPACTGLSKEAIAMAVGVLARRHLVTRSADRAVCLTGSGWEALEEHRARVDGEDGDDLRGALQTLLDNTEALAAGLQPPAGCWRSRQPYASRTHRLIADPTGTLPWQPMVLHRGGWPDGS